MSGQDKVLVKVLAAVDATFAPNRQWAPHQRMTNIYEARRDYPSAGVALRGGGKGAEQKRTERALDDLVQRGFVERIKNAVRTTGVRLTDAGEARARALCGLPDLACGVATVREVVAYSNAPGHPGLPAPGEPWQTGINWSGAWETWLAGVDWSETQDRAARRELVFQEECALPALLRGWLQAGSTLKRHVIYAATEAGRAVAVDPPPIEDVQAPGGVDWSEELRKRYYRAFKQASARFDTLTPQQAREIGMIAVPLCWAGYGTLEYRPKRG